MFLCNISHFSLIFALPLYLCLLILWSQEVAKKIGEAIAKSCLEKGITKVAFDRGGYPYHGRIEALADAARENGLDFWKVNGICSLDMLSDSIVRFCNRRFSFDFKLYISLFQLPWLLIWMDFEFFHFLNRLCFFDYAIVACRMKMLHIYAIQ